MSLSKAGYNSRVAEINGITIRTDWAPFTLFTAGDVVDISGVLYECLVTHTSSATFAADLSTKWIIHKLNIIAFRGLDTITPIDGGQLEGLRNKLIGGHFDRNPWQRGTTFTVTATGTYVADSWRVDFDGTANITVSKVALPVPQVINGVWCSYGLKFLVNSKSGNTFIRLSQRVEYVDTLTTMQATLQTAILGSGSFTVPVNARQNFGTSGSADVITPFASSLAVTSSLQQLNTGLTVPSIALKTIGTANDYLATEYDLLAIPSSGYVVIALAQLEPDSVATVFEQRPYGLELMLCQRYYEKSYAVDVAPGTAGDMPGFSAYSWVAINRPLYSCSFVVEKRVNPTVTIYNPSSGAPGTMRNIDALTNVTAFVVVAGRKNFISYNSGGGGSTGNAIQFHWTASAEL